MWISLGESLVFLNCVKNIFEERFESSSYTRPPCLPRDVGVKAATGEGQTPERVQCWGSHLCPAQGGTLPALLGAVPNSSQHDRVGQLGR